MTKSNYTMDQEARDANSLLVELARGLQAPNMGDQAEAVVRFTELFQRYPTPVIVNSSCLKLAEAFKCGSNSIKIRICEVFERNQSHLSKIYNVDDFFRNLFTVTNSNDPIARSITLLALGHIAPIVSGDRSIHHCISSSLETSWECELNATIACAAAFVKQSAEFACNIYPKIVSIIDSDKTSSDIKLRALSVLDHGFYTANDAMTVRSFLIDAMGKTHSKKLICAYLTLSTKIAYTSLSLITSQIELLSRTFLEDSRHVVRLNALKNLKFLAEKSPHIWESPHAEPFVSQLEIILADDDSTRSEFYSATILSIFCHLLTCECNFISRQEKNRIFQQCYKLALNDQNLTLCSLAFKLLTVMSEEFHHLAAANMIENQSNEMVSQTLVAIKTFLTQTSCSTTTSKTKRGSQVVVQRGKPPSHFETKAILRHIVKLCQLNRHYCSEILKLVFDKISKNDISLKDLNPYHTELMCALSPLSTDFKPNREKLLKIIYDKRKELSDTNMLNLSILYFQNFVVDKPEDATKLISALCSNRNDWMSFKVLRQAMRYGHFLPAQVCLTQLSRGSTSDTQEFFYRGLSKISSAEMSLQGSNVIDCDLISVIADYEKSMSLMRASTGIPRTTNFQLQYLELRIRTLQAHLSLRRGCRIYETSPITYTAFLGAIGAIRGGNSDPEISKLIFIQQMPRIAKDFRYLGDCYESLILVLSNSDHRSLDYIRILKASCIIMANAIDAIFHYGKNLPVISKLPVKSGHDLALEHRRLAKTCIHLIETIRNEIVQPGILPSQKPIDPLINLLKSFSDQLLSCPFIYARCCWSAASQCQRPALQ